MERRILLSFLIVGSLVLFFVIIFDRWGQKAFVTTTLSFFAPSKDKRSFKNIKDESDRSRNKSVYDFPKNFLIGTSSSAYQIEGGWNEGGKSPSIWDDFVHFHPKAVDDNTTADVGADSYHNYKEDVRALKLVGHYRFSISWTRIIPNGSAVNQDGIDYYSKLIDELIANNIEPMVTIFHWDIPCWLQDLGGLTNPIFIDYFRRFSDVLFENFGSRVKTWITVNEPFNFCTISYGSGVWAPGVKSHGVGEYFCGHYMMLAHASAYHLYKEKYFDKQRGSIGITLDSRYYYPKNPKVKPQDLQRAQNYRLGWFAHPIFSKEGDYPRIMIDEIGARSKLEGRSFSRLPEMDDETKALLKGSSDFFGLNYYTSRLLDVDKKQRDLTETPAWFKDARSLISINSTWKRAESSWLYSVPEGLRDLINWIKNEYNNPPIFITENGWSDGGELVDDGRIEYLKTHLIAVSKAINEDGCNVIGYTAWSLLDSFEWNRGYLEKFGLFSVNMTSSRRERTAKKSVGFLRKFLNDRFLVYKNDK